MTAAGRLDRREMVLLRLRSGDGLVGLGEAVPLSLRGDGATLGQVVDELEQLGERESLDEATLTGGATALSPPARCAALTALMDLRGRRAAGEHPTPPASSRPVPCNATLVAGEPAQVAADAARWAADGFSTFKLKLGSRRRRRAGARGARGDRAGGAHPGRRERRLGRGDREADARRARGARHRAGGAASCDPGGDGRGGRGDLDPDRGRRERREPRRRRAGGRDREPAS